MQNKHELASTLRKAADLIENADLPDACMVSGSISIHPAPFGEETRRDLKRIVRSFPRAKFDSYDGSTWAVYRPSNISDFKITIFFDRSLMKRPK